MTKKRYRRQLQWVVGAILSVAAIFLSIAWKEYAARERFVQFYETVETLGKTRATSDDVLSALGEPVSTRDYKTYVAWYYKPGLYKGRPQPMVVIGIDYATKRVTEVRYLVLN
jgi:hypothetical protein